MEAYWGSGGIAPLILWPRHYMEVSRQLYTQGKSPWYPLDRRLGGPQSCSGRGGEEKNSQSSPGMEPENRSPVLLWHRTPENVIYFVITQISRVVSNHPRVYTGNVIENRFMIFE
jgi:hypothetical protein